MHSTPAFAPDAGPPRLGVDVARHGTDRTVFLVRDDIAVRHVESKSDASTMETAGRAVDLMRRWGVVPEHVFIDDTGLGAGVTDRLRELGYDVTPVVAAARAADPTHFANRRAECYWRVRAALDPARNERGRRFCIPSRYRELHRELAALTFEYASTGAIRIVDKVALRGRLGRSPDDADALALTFADPATVTPAVTII